MRQEDDIRVHGESIGTASVRKLSGRQSLVGATLVFDCQVALTAIRTRSLKVSDVTGHLSVDGRDLGPVWLLNGVMASPENPSSSFTLCATAGPGIIRALDRMRSRSQSDALPFTLWLQLHGATEHGLFVSSVTINLSVTASDWFGALKTAAYESRHIIDVPVEGAAVDGVLADAALHYRRALEQFTKGSRVQVLVECRKVMEVLRDQLELKPAGIGEWSVATKDQWRLERRMEYARAAVHELLHPAAHPGTDDDPGPSEVDLVLGLVGSFLRYYAEGPARYRAARSG